MPASGDDLYRRHGPALVRKAERILQNREDALDLVHTLFVDLLQSEQTPDLPYLFRAATNRCLNHLRDQSNRVRLLARQDPTLRGPVRTRCDEQVLGIDLLLKLIDRMDAAAVEVLVLRFFDDLSLDEIAEVCGQSRRTVARRLDQARIEVTRLLEGAEVRP
jgi:RNA polymerase sigma factor (sigma-70 family)